MSFGQYIRQLRNQRGLAQLQLAEQAEIQNTYLSKIENDRVESPSEDVLLRLAKVLEVDSNRLIVTAGKVPTEFQKIIINNEEVFQFLDNYVKGKK